jgi:hypothetical protein
MLRAARGGRRAPVGRRIRHSGHAAIDGGGPARLRGAVLRWSALSQIRRNHLQQAILFLIQGRMVPLDKGQPVFIDCKKPFYFIFPQLHSMHQEKCASSTRISERACPVPHGLHICAAENGCRQREHPMCSAVIDRRSRRRICSATHRVRVRGRVRPRREWARLRHPRSAAIRAAAAARGRRRPEGSCLFWNRAWQPEEVSPTLCSLGKVSHLVSGQGGGQSPSPTSSSSTLVSNSRREGG